MKNKYINNFICEYKNTENSNEISTIHVYIHYVMSAHVLDQANSFMTRMDTVTTYTYRGFRKRWLEVINLHPGTTLRSLMEADTVDDNKIGLKDGITGSNSRERDRSDFR